MRCLCLALVLLLGWSTAAPAASGRFAVLLILYRGVTPAEQGFMEYLKPRLPVDFTIRDVDGNPNRVGVYVDEAKRMRPDLIYTFGTTVTLGTVGALGRVDPSRNITDVPVVFNIVADPVGARLATGFAPTGRNVTGVSHLVPMADQLKTVERFKPLKRLGVIYNPREENSRLAVVQLREQAGLRRFELREAPVTVDVGRKPTVHDIAAAFHALAGTLLDFIYLPSDSSLIEQAAAITRLGASVGVPVISATEGPIRRGGALLGLVSNYYNAGAFAGFKAEQVLTRRSSVETIPVQTLERFTLLVNMPTAVHFGIYPPMDLIKISELLR